MAAEESDVPVPKRLRIVSRWRSAKQDSNLLGAAIAAVVVLAVLIWALPPVVYRVGTASRRWVHRLFYYGQNKTLTYNGAIAGIIVLIIAAGVALGIFNRLRRKLK